MAEIIRTFSEPISQGQYWNPFPISSASLKQRRNTSQTVKDGHSSVLIREKTGVGVQQVLIKVFF